MKITPDQVSSRHAPRGTTRIRLTPFAELKPRLAKPVPRACQFSKQTKCLPPASLAASSWGSALRPPSRCRL